MREFGSKTITSKKELEEYLKIELPLYGCGFKSYIPIGEKAILRKHQYLLRTTEYYSNSGGWRRILALIQRIRLLRLQNKYSLHIPLNTCGKGLHIVHLGSILINDEVRIGENCVLHINTCIVAGGTNNNVPRLDDGVIIGVGAVVLGNVTLGKNIAVGANSVVNKSFSEENIAIAGIPAKKISNNGRLSWGNN